MFWSRHKCDVMAELREAALRAIWKLERPEGPGQDINPHTAGIDSYTLASMLTFSARGDRVEVGDPIDRLAHMIYAGTPERIQSRRAWVIWELERLAEGDQAQRLAHLVDTAGGSRVAPVQ